MCAFTMVPTPAAVHLVTHRHIMEVAYMTTCFLQCTSSWLGPAIHAIGTLLQLISPFYSGAPSCCATLSDLPTHLGGCLGDHLLSAVHLLLAGPCSWYPVLQRYHMVSSYPTPVMTTLSTLSTVKSLVCTRQTTSSRAK